MGVTGSSACPNTAEIAAILALGDVTSGMVFKGTVSTYTNTTTFASTDLSGYGDGAFVGWYVVCSRDAGGAGAAPQQQSPVAISAYTSSTGAFTHTAFGSGNLAATDEVMLINPLIMLILNRLGAFSGDGGTAADDSTKAILDLIKAQTDLVALASVLGALNSAAATGVVTNTDVAMAYIKQLVTNMSDDRGGYLDELAAANIPADVDTLLTRTADLTSMVLGQEVVGATAVDGTTWKDLLDKSVLTTDVIICGFLATSAGGWAGDEKIRIVDGAGTTKLWPFGAEAVEATDWTSGVIAELTPHLIVPLALGYKVQFRSSNAGDGAGKTLAITVNKIGWT